MCLYGKKKRSVLGSELVWILKRVFSKNKKLKNPLKKLTCNLIKCKRGKKKGRIFLFFLKLGSVWLGKIEFKEGRLLNQWGWERIGKKNEKKKEMNQSQKG